MEENNFFLKIVKLKTTQKLPDRNFINEVYIPKNEREEKLGSLLLLVEILSPWFPAADVGKLIFDTLTKKYYSQEEHEDIQQKLEEALKAVNKKLAETANKGEVEWLGNLNAVCVVVKGKNLYLAQTGEADAYLFRGTSFSYVTEGLKKEETPHPLKTFTNLTSGDLESGDKILITSKELFSDIPFQETRDSITENKLVSATKKIKKTLIKKKSQKINFILLGVIKTKEKRSPKIHEIPLDEKKDGWLTKTAKLVKPAIDVPNGTMTEKEIAEKIAKDKKSSISKRFFIAIGKQTIKIGERFSGNFKKKNRREQAKENLTSGKINTKLYTKEQSQGKKIGLGEKTIKAIFAIFLGIGRLFASLFQPGKRLPKIILIIIVVILLIFGISALRKSQARREAEFNAWQLLAEAQEKEKQGDEKLALNQEAEAKKLFIESIDLAEKASEHPKVEEEAIAFISKVQVKIDQADNITRLTSLEQIVDFGSQNNIQPLNFCLIEKDFYTINPITGQLTKFETGISKISNSGTAGIIQEPLFAICTINNIYAYTKAKHLYRYDLSGEAQLVATGTNNTWAEAMAGFYFADNIYLLDAVNGQIWKHRPEGDNFSSSIEFLNTAQTDIKNAKTFAIDGYVYLATRTNKLIKMLSGTVQEDFKLTDIPTPLNKVEDAISIYTDLDLNFVYVLDKQNRRAIEADKEGLYTRQFVFPEDFKDLKQIYVSQKNKKMYIMNGSAVYEVEI